MLKGANFGGPHLHGDHHAAGDISHGMYDGHDGADDFDMDFDFGF